MSCCDTFKTFCIFVVLIQLVCGVFRWIYENIIGPRFYEGKDLKTFGQWAVVTGATDGIGKEYARMLAKRGLNIILISRTLSKLETVAKEIQQSFKVQTVVIDVDFTSGPEIYDKIKEKVKDREIGILVNNVGMCYETPDYFLSIPNREKLTLDMINCNITSMPMMCSIVMPQMVQRKRGLVINLASIAAVLPGSMMTIYAATKAFVNKFSEDLAAEYLYQGITVQSILPGPVSTKMLIIDDIPWLTPSAEKYVESALKTVGFASEANGYFAHSIIQYFSQLINFISPWLAHTISMQSLKAIHNQQIKKGFKYESEKN